MRIALISFTIGVAFSVVSMLPFVKSKAIQKVFITLGTAIWILTASYAIPVQLLCNYNTKFFLAERERYTDYCDVCKEFSNRKLAYYQNEIREHPWTTFYDRSLLELEPLQ